MYEQEMNQLSEKMDKSITALKNEFTTIRTGQANASLLDRVFVEYYGSRTPVTQVASVTVPEARLLVVQPWDKTLLKDIEKAILQSDLGLVPMNDGNLIRMAIPQLTEERRKELVNEAIQFVGLEDYCKTRPGKLSGGLLRRLNIACGIAHKPRLIIMDEPTVAVDPQSRNKILEGIQKLNEQGSTIIYTSHYMEEVEQICTRIAIMDHGRVIASGTTEELKKMIKTGETITVEAILLEEKHLQDIRNLSHVFDVHYENQILSLRCTGAQHNLIRLLNYLQSQDITFGRVFSELPTLNDVFLEITGKQLRD